MHRQKSILFLFFFAPFATSSEENSYLAKEDKEISFEKFFDITYFATEFLEAYNDRHLGSSKWGRLLGYEDMKRKICDSRSSLKSNSKCIFPETGRGLKKMSMAMMPLVFQVGAASTWMILTSIMAVKSVAIGLILLVFKIAVSSAKVASFFTTLKSKHAEHHEYARAPHEVPTHDVWNSYEPEWGHSDSHIAYRTIPMYKESHISNDIEYEEQTKHENKKMDNK